MLSINSIIAKELNVQVGQVDATVDLLDNGDSVPFIARYRKEVTSGLDDTQLRAIVERLDYLRELEERKKVILNEISRQGKLTPELNLQIITAETKARVEDLYKPYKPTRTTRGQLAIAAGLEPLADLLLNNPDLDPNIAAEAYINVEKEINDVKRALEGAKYILMERFAVIPDLVGTLRSNLWEYGTVTSNVKDGCLETGQNYKDYFDFKESLKTIPSYRALAILRGRNEDFLTISVVADFPFEQEIAKFVNIENKNRPADQWLQDVVKWTWQVKLKVQLEVELLSTMREQAEAQAITVFAENLRDLLMASPAGQKVTIGLDPGIRTGVKYAVVDETGKLLKYGAIFPHAPRNQWAESIMQLKELCVEFKIQLISIGNGTASRETDLLVADLLQKFPDLKATKIVVSEAGASVYSASEIASQEFNDVDVSYRGAISIARRLQDPLAELVKITPESIGVGLYQHDLRKSMLTNSLNSVVEDCVNKVGVDINTASVPLLTKVSGLNRQVAENIVAFRNQHGAFINRQKIKEVSRISAKVFEQCAGFLRIRNGDNILDMSAVHPESYELVDVIANKVGKPIAELINNKTVINTLKASDFVSDKFGLPTVFDVLAELEKPGRDPRPVFITAKFKEGVNSITDLKIGMLLEGVVTNVANFGAFVDIGVHQDGLVHISNMSKSFITAPRDVVKAGDIIKVKVVEIDIARKRVGLSMLLDVEAKNDKNKSSAEGALGTSKVKSSMTAKAKPIRQNSVFADLLAQAMEKNE
jgi:uncharacterized protein